MTAFSNSKISPSNLPERRATTRATLSMLGLWGKCTPFLKVMMIRGIGYRFFYAENDFILIKNEMSAAQKVRTGPHSFLANETHDDDELEELPTYWDSTASEFQHSRYLIVRAGHSTDLYVPLPPGVFVKTSKKDRKLTIYSATKQEVYNLARQIYDYRRPSPYTGRGIRRKQIKVLRKIGKRDKQ